jgi:hypothetical protein
VTEPAPPPSLEEQAANCKANAEHWRGLVKAAFAQARETGTLMAYRQALEYVRAVQDNMEEYVSLAISVRGALGRGAMDAQLTYDEAWAQQADLHSRTGVRRGEEMEGPRERYARWDVKVFAQLRAARQAEKQKALAQELLDDMWLRYRAINATREDIAQVLRSYAFESSLER